MDLYRFYDDNDRLLYIGISLHAAQRASEHSKQKPWWPDVHRMHVEHLACDRREALQIERDAIVVEAPLHNVTHNIQAETPTVANDNDVAPIEFDAALVVGWDFEDREAVRHLAEAMDALARRLDRRDREEDEVLEGGRASFLKVINGMARSLVYGDCCNDCFEIRYPLILQYESPTQVRCGYICDQCANQWPCWWTADLAVLAACG